jgi:hypothetical protein
MANGLFNLKQVVQAVQQGGWPAQKTPAVEYLVVAGGGGGGRGGAGGGGAGGLLQGTVSVPSAQTLVVTVGTGGASPGGYGDAGSNGTNSVFGGLTALGGGGGSAYYATGGKSGGSGGGGADEFYIATYLTALYPGQGTFGQGNAGGFPTSTGPYATGGGGAGTVGLTGAWDGGSSYGGNGGAGIASAISGTVTAYAGGGAGGGGQPASTPTGGVGGGGNGGSGAGNVPTAGAPNTGGGGGGDWNNISSAGTGGSGIVIVSYPDVYAAATTVNATASTSGSGSTAFSSSAYIRYAGQSAFAFGSGDFTIEGWFYSTALGVLVWDFRNAGATDGTFPTLELSANGQVQYFVNGSYRISSAVGLNTVNTWAHIAIVRSGTVTKMFFNGTQAGSSYTDTTNYTVGAAAPTIGAGAAPSAYFAGYISNFRVVKGVCVYTGTFTPPTAPLQATQPAGTNIAAITSTSTSLLLNTNSGAFLADNSTNSFTQATSAGTLAWNASSPFTGTGYKNRVYTWTTSGTITF